MNIHTLILSLLFVTPAFGADEKKPEKQEVIGNVAADSALGKLLSVPGVDAIYKQCDKDNASQKENVPDCIWKEVSKNEGLKKQVQAKYQEIVTTKPLASNGGRAPASDMKGAKSEATLTARNVNIATDYNSDPGVNALSDFFGSKLAEVLHPEVTKENKVTTLADHEKFIALYKTVLGKSLVNSLTAYCLNTDQKKCIGTACVYDEKKKQENVNGLKGASLTDDSLEGIKWKNCIASVSNICYNNPLKKDDDLEITDDDVKRSQNKACLVMDFVKSARKNIIVAEKQETFYSKLEKSDYAVKGFNSATGEKADEDNLTELTSSDLEKEYVGDDGKKTTIKAENEKLAKGMENCLDDKGNVKNEGECKKYINTNKDENDKSFVEFALSQNIEEERLVEKLKDEKNVAAYLKEEGYTDEQIKQMTDKDNIENIRKDIQNRFKAEKEAIIAEMQSKIEKKTTTKNGEVTSSGSKLNTIKKQFEERTQELGQLIKFNNIVSSYLTVEDNGPSKQNNDQNKKVQRNTASLIAEINSMKGDDAKEFKEKLEKAELTKSKNAKLNTEQINCAITKYSSQADCKK